MSDQICRFQETLGIRTAKGKAEPLNKCTSLGISLRKTYYLCEHTADFKVIRLGKRCLRIHKESFDSWFNALDQP